MAGNKYTTFDDTDQITKEIASNNSSSGPGDANKIVSLNAAGEIDSTMIPSLEVLNLPTSETLAAGDYIYINGSGEATLASAASGGNAAIGYVKVAAVHPTTVDVYFDGLNTALSGLTVGDQYFLSDTTPGGITDTAPVGSNKIIESLGWAINATTIQTNFTAPIKRA